MANDPRVQIRDLPGPEPIRPAPIQSDTFTGAPRVDDAGAGYMQLAQALGHFSTALSQLSRSNIAKGKKDMTLENEFAKMTEEQRAHVARTGTMPDGTKLNGNYHGPAIMKAAGMADASVYARHIMDYMQNGYDWSKGNVDAFLTGAQNKYLQDNGITDPYAVKGFLQRFNNVREWALQEENKYRETAKAKYAGDVSFQLMQDGINQMIDKGLSPQEIHTKVRDMYSILGKKGTLGLDYNQLDKFVVHIAGNLAATHPNIAKELITAPRPGAGPAAAPIASKLDYKTQTEAIMKAADKALVKRAAEQSEHDLYANNLKRVIKDGDLSAFQDKVFDDGTETGLKVTKKEQEDNFAQSWVHYNENLVKEGKMSELAAADQETYVLRSMGLDHPYLVNEVNHLEKRISPDMLSNPTQMKDFETRIRKYREIRAASKSYAQSQISKPTLEFLDAIDAAQKYEHYDLDRAIIFAEKVTSDKDGQQVSLAHYRPDIKRAVERQFGTGMMGFGNDLNNDGVMMGTYIARVEHFAGMLVKGGFEPKKAIKIATKRLYENMPTYHGRAMPGLEQQPLADNWQEGLDSLIQKKIIPNLSKDFKGQEVFPLILEGGRMTFETADGTIVKNKDGYPMGTSVALINNEAKRLQGEAKRTHDQKANEAIQNAVKDQHANKEFRAGNKALPGVTDFPSLESSSTLLHRGK